MLLQPNKKTDQVGVLLVCLKSDVPGSGLKPDEACRLHSSVQHVDASILRQSVRGKTYRFRTKQQVSHRKSLVLKVY